MTRPLTIIILALTLAGCAASVTTFDKAFVTINKCAPIGPLDQATEAPVVDPDPQPSHE